MFVCKKMDLRLLSSMQYPYAICGQIMMNRVWYYPQNHISVYSFIIPSSALMVPKGRVCHSCSIRSDLSSIEAESSDLFHSSLSSRRAASAYFTSVQLLPFGKSVSI